MGCWSGAQGQQAEPCRRPRQRGQGQVVWQKNKTSPKVKRRTHHRTRSHMWEKMVPVCPSSAAPALLPHGLSDNKTPHFLLLGGCSSCSMLPLFFFPTFTLLEGKKPRRCPENCGMLPSPSACSLATVPSSTGLLGDGERCPEVQRAGHRAAPAPRQQHLGQVNLSRMQNRKKEEN